MKAALVSINSQYIHSSLAVWYLAAQAEETLKNTCEIKVIEGTINQDMEMIFNKIFAYSPDLIAFSCYIWNKTYCFTLASLIKNAMPGVKIVFGGPEVSFNPMDVLTVNECIDYILSGEGEEPFSDLVRALTDEALPLPKSLSYRKDGKIMVGIPYYSGAEPISPYSDKYIDCLEGRIAYIESSRGCPFRCSFCLSGRIGRVVTFDIERTKREMLLLAGSGTKTIKFVDRTFNADRNHARSIYKFIAENYGKAIPDGVCFHFEIAGDLLDEEDFAILSNMPAGAIQFEIGLQSMNPDTLDRINRKTNMDILIKNIARLISQNNIHIHIDLIAGLPYEGFDSFKTSFLKSYDLHPHMLQLGFLKLLHGSPLKDDDICAEYTFSSDPPYQVIDNNWITKAELDRLHAVDMALDRLYNSGRFSRTLEYLQSCGLDMFDFFEQFGRMIIDNSWDSVSLDEISEDFYNFSRTFSCVNSGVLRDKLVCDRLSVNNSGFIPKFLQIKDSALKSFKAELEKSENTKKHPGVKRGAALLYSMFDRRTGVYTDYSSKHPVTGQYELNFYPF